MCTAGPLGLARDILDDGSGEPFFVLNRCAVSAWSPSRPQRGAALAPVVTLRRHLMRCPANWTILCCLHDRMQTGAQAAFVAPPAALSLAGSRGQGDLRPQRLCRHQRVPASAPEAPGRDGGVRVSSWRHEKPKLRPPLLLLLQRRHLRVPAQGDAGVPQGAQCRGHALHHQGAFLNGVERQPGLLLV